MKTYKEFITEASILSRLFKKKDKDSFIADPEYDALSDHVSKKHPGYKVHALGRDHETSGIKYQAYHKDDKDFKKPVSGTFKA